MEKSSKILSDIVIHNKYAKYNQSEQRRETYDEIVDRNLKMHMDKFRGNTEVVTAILEVYRD